jgi:hypothetical protein
LDDQRQIGANRVTDGELLKTTTWSGAIAGSVTRNYDNFFRLSSEQVGDAVNNELGCDYGEDPDVDCALQCYSAAIGGELWVTFSGDGGY